MEANMKEEEKSDDIKMKKSKSKSKK